MALGQKNFFCRNVCRTKGLDLKSSKMKKNFCRKSFPANLLPGKVRNFVGVTGYKFRCTRSLNRINDQKLRNFALSLKLSLTLSLSQSLRLSLIESLSLNQSLNLNLSLSLSQSLSLSLRLSLSSRLHYRQNPNFAEP
jgi:hypothetical protein